MDVLPPLSSTIMEVKWLKQQAKVNEFVNPRAVDSHREFFANAGCDCAFTHIIVWLKKPQKSKNKTHKQKERGLQDESVKRLIVILMQNYHAAPLYK